MKLRTSIIASILCILLLANMTFAGTVDINTGLDLTNSPATLPIGPDPFWRVVATPTNASMNVPSTILATVSGWFPPQAGSQWIYAGTNAAGRFIYERCFCLKNPDKTSMTLSLRADNRATVYLNDYTNNVLQTVADYSFSSKGPNASTATKPFIPGKNCIRVVVQNDGGPTGMNLVGSVTGPGAQETADDCCRATKRLFTSALPGGGTSGGGPPKDPK